ncbi:MAG: beta-propeller domain-containing protein, partial [Phycisphaerales bacterium]|nr:beta-propeller domain-containing protein [Phycisphaerales bacterium]
APGETIQSARFLGDKGFLVTFRQVDPFFTMDLSDPANPHIVGELKVPGYSTFLTPIDENHILAVGQYIPPDNTFGNWGVQLSIFDVTDFANPTQTSNVVIGADTNASAYSEALWDPKAFTYFAEGGVVALPVSIYEYVFFEGDGGGVAVDPGQIAVTQIDTGSGTDGSTGTDAGAPPPDGTVVDVPVDVVDTPPQTGFDGVFVYRVSAADGLTELGRISTRFEEAQYWGASFTRGVFVGQDVYAVTDLGVHSASMNDLSTEESQLFFGLPYDIVEEPPILIDPMPVERIDGGATTPDGTSTSDPGTTSADTSTVGVTTPAKPNP